MTVFYCYYIISFGKSSFIWKIHAKHHKICLVDKKILHEYYESILDISLKGTFPFNEEIHKIC
jgi:hypothetical protein